MIVVVLGMHRSGTSAITRLLSLAGATLGPEDELVAAAPDNPRGFWENRGLVVFNERLLAALGATSTAPPSPGAIRREAARLAPMRQEAADLAAQTFPGNGPHVWKDPRTCLTLEFWREILAPIVVVLPVRNPLEIAASLEKRDRIPIEVGLCLWEEYTRRALEASADLPRVVVRFDRVLADPCGETERLIDALRAKNVRGLTVPPRDRVLEFVDPKLRHATAGTEEFLRESVATAEQRALFEHLLALADGEAPAPLPTPASSSATVLGLFRSSREGEKATHQLVHDLASARAELERAQAERDEARLHLEHMMASNAWKMAGRLQQAKEGASAWGRRHPLARALLWPARVAWRRALLWQDERRGGEVIQEIRSLGRHAADEASSWFRTRHSAGDPNASYRPIVHVIVTTRDDAGDLPELLLSLCAQTLPRFQLTIVDDASTSPASLSILQSLAGGSARDTTLLRVERAVGPAAARNRALRALPDVPYVLCVAPGDLLAPSFLERAVWLLDSRPEVGLAYSDYALLERTKRVVHAPEYDLTALLERNFLGASPVYRRGLWEQVGGYDESASDNADWDLWIRFAKAGWFGERIPGVLRFRPALPEESLAALRSKHAELYEPQRRHALDDLWRSGGTLPRPRAGAPLDARPMVSVVVPCYNQGETLDATVRSVLAQTYSPVELVILDDGSTDAATIAALDRWAEQGIRVVRQENAGLASARNAAINAARGPLILPLDSDDVLLPEMVERCVQELAGDPTIGFVYTDMLFFGDEDGIYAQFEFNPWHELTNNHVTVCAMFRKSDWKAAGGYFATDIRPPGIEDWHLWLSLTRMGRFGRLVPLPLFGYRRRRGSMSDRMREVLPHLISELRNRHEDLFLPAAARRLHDTYPRSYTGSGARYGARPGPAPPAAAEAPFFSLVVSLDGAHVRSCVESVLAQEGADFELLLVESDAPREGERTLFEEVASNPRCRVVRNPERRDAGHLRNGALDVARGSWIAFIDAEDELVPGALAAVAECVSAGEGKTYVSSGTIEIDGRGRVVGRRTAGEAPWDLDRTDFGRRLGFVAREALELVGPFDASFDTHHDYDLALRCAELRPLTLLDDALLRRRLPSAPRSLADDRARQETFERVQRLARLRRFLADDSIRKGELFAVEALLLGDDVAPPPLPRSFDVTITRAPGDWAAGAADISASPARERELLATLATREGPPWVLLVGAEMSLAVDDLPRLIACGLGKTRSIAVPVASASRPLFASTPVVVPGQGVLFPREALAALRDPHSWREALTRRRTPAVHAWRVRTSTAALARVP